MAFLRRSTHVSAWVRGLYAMGYPSPCIRKAEELCIIDIKIETSRLRVVPATSRTSD